MRFYLLPWEQGWMKMFHGSAAASSPLARACTCSLYTPLSERIRRTRTLRLTSVSHVCAGGLLPRALFLWKDIVLYAERSVRLRERIGPEEAFPTSLLVL